MLVPHMKASGSFFGALAFLSTTCRGTLDNTHNHSTGFHSPHYLASTGDCPENPKFSCEDAACDGSFSIGLDVAPYTCRNESPSLLPDLGVAVIARGCRCCPQPIQVFCENVPCGAPPGSRICEAEPLRGCACWTFEDRRAGAVRPSQPQPRAAFIMDPNPPPPDPRRGVEAAMQVWERLGMRPPGAQNDTEPMELDEVDEVIIPSSSSTARETGPFASATILSTPGKWLFETC